MTDSFYSAPGTWHPSPRGIPLAAPNDEVVEVLAALLEPLRPYLKATTSCRTCVTFLAKSSSECLRFFSALKGTQTLTNWPPTPPTRMPMIPSLSIISLVEQHARCCSRDMAWTLFFVHGCSHASSHYLLYQMTLLFVTGSVPNIHPLPCWSLLRQRCASARIELIQKSPDCQCLPL